MEGNKATKAVPSKKIVILIIAILILVFASFLGLSWRGGKTASISEKLVQVNGGQPDANRDSAKSEAANQEEEEAAAVASDKAEFGEKADYKNEKLGVQFGYPTKLKLVSDGCASPKEKECDWRRIVFSGANQPGKPELKIDINPDDMKEPDSPGAFYDLEETVEGTIRINSEEHLPSDEDALRNKRYTVIASVASAKNDSQFTFQLTFDKDVLDWQPVLREIIASVQFAKNSGSDGE